MTETAQQYVERILRTLDATDPLAVLEKTPAQLTGLLARFSKEQLWKRPAPGKWSPAEIAIHLSETEIAVGLRMRMVVGSNGIAIQGFDQDSWATRYDHTDFDIAMNSFRALRAANLDMYRRLTPEQWEQYGMHSERGKETARRIVQLCAGHDINHLRQIEALAP